MREKLKKFHIGSEYEPLIVLLFTLAAHIPLAAQLGFYWDDWPMLYFKLTRGAAGFASAFNSDRPFLSYLYQLTSFLPDNPAIWQILTVLVRWLLSLSFIRILKQLWDGHDKEILWMGILLAVYPGFKQMPIVYVWLNGFILLLAYVLSYVMMLESLRGCGRSRIIWLILSLLSFSFCIVSTEYYVGLELSRGIVLYLYFNKDDNFKSLPVFGKLKKIAAWWFPFILILGSFMFWRVFIFKFPGYQPVLVGQAAASPLKALFDTAVRAIEDAYTASWGAWTEFIRFPNHVDFETLSGKIFWAATALTFAAALFAIRFYDRKGESRSSKWTVPAMLIGLFMIIIPGFPFWVTYLPIRLSYPYDRFLVALMFGSCIFMTGLIGFSLRPYWMRSAATALLVAAATGGNILNANSYRKDWNMQKDFITQLTTRIPSLKPDTVLLTDNNPLSYESDNSMTGIVNLAFQPGKDYDNTRLPYSVMLFSPRFGNIENYEENDAIYQDFRGLLFKADPENTVVYHYSPPSCLRVIDPEQHDLLDIFPSSYRNFSFLSKPAERIITDKTSENLIFNSIIDYPAEDNWCYFFQKADLARQNKNWAEIENIGDKVLPYMSAADKSEYLVFAEAYMHTDRWDTAGELFGRIHHESEGTLDFVLCDYINRWISEYPPSPDRLDDFIGYMNAVGCVYDPGS